MKVAATAAAEWGTSPMSRRGAAMFRLRKLLDAHRDELAAIVTSEHGKVLEDARRGRAGIDCGSSRSRACTCSAARTARGVEWDRPRAHRAAARRRRPGLTPFNFPVMVPLWMLANALACGNAFVLKPSEKDPSASLRMAEPCSRPASLTACATSCRATPRRSTRRTHTHRCRRCVVRGEHPHRPARLRDRDVTRARPGAGGSEEPMVKLPDADLDRRRRGHLRPLLGLRGSVHGGLGRRGGGVGRLRWSVPSPTGSRVSSSVPATTHRR